MSQEEVKLALEAYFGNFPVAQGQQTRGETIGKVLPTVQRLINEVRTGFALVDDETAQRVVEILDARTLQPTTGLTPEDVKAALTEVFRDADITQ